MRDREGEAGETEVGLVEGEDAELARDAVLSYCGTLLICHTLSTKAVETVTSFLCGRVTTVRA